MKKIIILFIFLFVASSSLAHFSKGEVTAEDKIEASKLAKKAELALEVKDINKAVDLLDLAYQRDEHCSMAAFVNGRILFVTGRKKGALNVFKAIIDSSDDEEIKELSYEYIKKIKKGWFFGGIFEVFISLLGGILVIKKTDLNKSIGYLLYAYAVYRVFVLVSIMIL